MTNANDFYDDDEFGLAEKAFIDETYQIYLLDNGGIKQDKTSTTFAANSILALGHLINDLERVQGDIFVISDARRNPKHAEIHNRLTCSDGRTLKLFDELVWHLSYLDVYIDCELPHHIKNPKFAFFFTEAKRLGLYLTPIEFNRLYLGCGDDTKWFCDNLNRLVDSMRNIRSNKQVNLALKQFRRAARDNYESASEYIEDLFAVHSRMCVVRVDLSYLKQYAGNITAQEFLRHREKLLVYLQRHPIFENKVGYIIKAEHGRDKGFHLHAMIFFDGNLVREGISRATMIGDLWRDIITEGRGVHFNCNQHAKYYYNGIGMVRHDCVAQRHGLYYAFVYMTKTDEIARLSLGSAKIFLRGISPKIDEVKRGRPRMNATYTPHSDSQVANSLDNHRAK